jgi:hypothetical protein
MNDNKTILIDSFKKEDLITRVVPIMNPETNAPDYSLVGKKLIFLGIANASIYLKLPLSNDADNLIFLMFGQKEPQMVQLALDLYRSGWQYYIEPDFLNDNNISAEEDLKRQIRLAVDEENFERAEFLKKQLEELKSKK